MRLPGKSGLVQDLAQRLLDPGLAALARQLASVGAGHQDEVVAPRER